MKNIITITFALSLFSLSLNGQERHYIIKEELSKKLKINGLTLFDLNNPGEQFEKLQALGQLQDSSYSQTFIEELWEFDYPGIKLNYTNLIGKPQLYTFMLHSFDAVNLQLSGKRILSHSIELFDFENSNAAKVQVELVDEGMTRPEKFGGKYSYLELVLNSENQIQSLKFQDLGH